MTTTPDIGAAMARHLFKHGTSAVADEEVKAVMRTLRALDPNTILDEVDVRVVRDVLDSYRESRRPAVREDYA